MFIPEEMKLNKFVKVSVPEPSKLFARFGFGAHVPENAYSGEEVVTIGNKTDILADMEKYDAMKQQEEISKSE